MRREKDRKSNRKFLKISWKKICKPVEDGLVIMDLGGWCGFKWVELGLLAKAFWCGFGLSNLSQVGFIEEGGSFSSHLLGITLYLGERRWGWHRWAWNHKMLHIPLASMCNYCFMPSEESLDHDHVLRVPEALSLKFGSIVQ